MRLLIQIRSNKQPLPNLSILVDTETDLESLYQALATINMERSEVLNDNTIDADHKSIMLNKIDKEKNRIESDICFIKQNINQFNLAHGHYEGDLL